MSENKETYVEQEVSSTTTANVSRGLSSLTDNNSTSFVDYTLPPDVKIRPPAKHKLSILVFILVYFAEWFSTEAKYFDFLFHTVFREWLSPEATLFVLLGTIVAILVFSTMDLLIDLLTFKVMGREFGLGAWMKQGRAQWVNCYDNFLFVCLACIVRIFEDGFEIFNHPGALQSAPSEPREFHCRDGDCNTVLKIEHRINPEKMDAYKEWEKKIKKASANVRGLLKVEKSDIMDERDEEAADDLSESHHSQGNLHIVHLTFSNIDSLNDWMASPRRRALMQKLEPILLQPDVVKIQNKRMLPDAFTDLLIQQGSAVPTLPPKKWKVAFLTTVALFLSIRWTNHFLPYYYVQWGVDDADSRVLRIINVAIVTFVNSYVLTPLLLFAFSHWLIRTECELDKKEPWRTLNDGIESQWLKALITFAFYGGCLITWLVSQ